MGEDDVGGEQRSVRERERDSDRLALETDMREQIDACCSRDDRHDVARRAGADGREDDRADELDRRNRGQRQPVDRDIEADVHQGEDGSQTNDQRPSARIEREKRPPRPPPEREDRGGGGDPEPGDAQHVDPREQQHGEGRPEIVEDGAPDEVGLRGNTRVRVDGLSVTSRPPNRHGKSKVLDSSQIMKNGLLANRAADPPKLDATDRKIIGELTTDGRVSLAELGRRVNLSPPAVAERVQRLERSGVITGYRAEIDPRLLGYPLTAIVRIKPAPGQLPRIPELAAEIPEIGECHRITGEDCFYLKVFLRSIDELGALLDRFLVYGETTTSLINASPVPRRDPPLIEQV
jgi:Lrp/AsnC family leucine-responsive transcriptional regulator